MNVMDTVNSKDVIITNVLSGRIIKAANYQTLKISLEIDSILMILRIERLNTYQDISRDYLYRKNGP